MYQPVNCSYTSFCRFLIFLAYPCKLLMIYAAIRFTAGSDNELDYGNVHGCDCIYSTWCLNSEVHFDYFSTYVSIVIFYTFSFVCAASYFLAIQMFFPTCVDYYFIWYEFLPTYDPILTIFVGTFHNNAFTRCVMPLYEWFDKKRQLQPAISLIISLYYECLHRFN